MLARFVVSIPLGFIAYVVITEAGMLTEHEAVKACALFMALFTIFGGRNARGG